MPGAILKFLARSTDTGGAFALFEAKALPGFEPPPHVHLNEDEVYYILEGEVWFKVGGEELTGKKGDLVFLPRRVKHEFKILSKSLHCHVGLYPGGVDQYFIEMTSPATSIDIPPLAAAPPPPAAMERMARLNEQYGISYD
jgi:quercetin dioxygenase-like cupin family protein